MTTRPRSQMADGHPPDKGLGDILHFDRRLNPGGNAERLEHALDGEGIHHGGEHSHIIGGGPLHTALARAHPAPKISATYDHGDFQPRLVGLFDLFGQIFDNLRGNVVLATVPPQCLTAQLEDDTFEITGMGSGHRVIVSRGDSSFKWGILEKIDPIQFGQRYNKLWKL